MTLQKSQVSRCYYYMFMYACIYNIYIYKLAADDDDGL